jgi:hypothetical protein
MATTTTSDRVARKLTLLSADYQRVTGGPFHHFYCPMLYRDEAVELCAAHIVNEAFGISSAWTVQRKDVDGFFGSAFESDFVVLKDRGRSLAEVVTDPVLSRRLRPTFEVDGRTVAHYRASATRPVPKTHSRMIIGAPGNETHLALKIPPEDLRALTSGNWRINVEKDVRIPAVVAVLKAAHLTMFEMLGYEYALSLGGETLGREALGRFFENNHGRPKAEIQANAREHFREFAHMVRPVLSVPDTFKGTAEDHGVYICERGDLIRWGMIVFVRTAVDSVHAVLVPLMETELAARVFMNFLRSSEDEQITARLAWFRGDKWEASTETVTYGWPKTGAPYPG